MTRSPSRFWMTYYGQSFSLPSFSRTPMDRRNQYISLFNIVTCEIVLATDDCQ